jgi:hypothetical protein
MKNIRHFISRWANLVESRDEEVDFATQRAFSNSERDYSQLKDLNKLLKDILDGGLSMELMISLVRCIDFDSQKFRDNLKCWEDAENEARDKKLDDLAGRYSSLVGFLKTLRHYGSNISSATLSDDGEEVYESSDAKLQMMIMMMDENGYEQDGEGLEFSNLTGRGPERLSFDNEKDLEEFVINNILRK